MTQQDSLWEWVCVKLKQNFLTCKDTGETCKPVVKSKFGYELSSIAKSCAHYSGVKTSIVSPGKQFLCLHDSEPVLIVMTVESAEHRNTASHFVNKKRLDYWGSARVTQANELIGGRSEDGCWVLDSSNRDVWKSDGFKSRFTSDELYALRKRMVASLTVLPEREVPRTYLELGNLKDLSDVSREIVVRFFPRIERFVETEIFREREK